MSKTDFDFQKHVDVPEKWIENALKIPQIAPIKPKVMLFPRRCIAAASIVLVTVLSVSAYFFFGNKKQIPVAPVAPAVSTEAPTEYAATAPTQTPAESASTTKPSTVPTAAPETQIATDSEGRITVITITTRTDDTQPTTPPLSPTVAKQPSTEQSSKPSIKPTMKPTEAAVVKPPESQKAESTKAPTTLPTEAPLIEEDIRTIEIRVTFDASDIIQAAADSEDIYCRVYDGARNLLGDENLYSRSHLASFSVEGSGWQSVNYIYSYTGEYDAATAVGDRFTYEFYNDRGEVIYIGSINV